MVTLGVCLLYELPAIVGILIHAHLAVLIIIRYFAYTNTDGGQQCFVIFCGQRQH